MKRITLLSACLAMSLNVHAALVQVPFTVTVTFSSVSGVLAGDVLSGSYTYDDTVAGVTTPAPNPFIAANVLYSSVLTEMTVDVAGTIVGGTTGDIRYTDSVNRMFTGDDLLGINPDNSTFVGELNPARQLTSMSIFGSDPSAMVVDLFTDPDPLATISPAAFPDLRMQLGFGSLPGQILDTINGSVTIATVPLPPAIWLFASGVAGLLLKAKRRAINHT